MKRIYFYLAAIVATVAMCIVSPAPLTFLCLVMLLSGLGIVPRHQLCDTCIELAAFRVATESLDHETIRMNKLGKAYYFRNATRMGEYPLNVGVTRSVFNIMSTEPSDDPSLWNNVTLVAGATSPGCDTNYEDVSVNYYERTYGPKRRRFRGPVLCRDQFKYQHLIDDFISDYTDEMGKHSGRVWEFALRNDYMGFGDWWVDGSKTNGPNAVLTAPLAFQDLTLSGLELVTQDLINSGAGAPDEMGYVMDGPLGPVFPFYLDMVDSAQIFRANPNLREDAHFAGMGKDGEGNYVVWQKLGATRVLQNTRFVATDIAPRYNYTGGQYVIVPPFKTIAQMGSDDDQLTTAYKNAAFHAGIYHHPDTFKCEAVRPQSAGLSWNPIDYNGDLRFYTGGERICTPGRYDPEHELGRHFWHIEYAPKPRKIHYSKVVIYKNCAQTQDQIFCS